MAESTEWPRYEENGNNNNKRGSGLGAAAGGTLVGLGIGLAAGWCMERIMSGKPLWNSEDRGTADSHSGAFRSGETDPENRDQTRHAGPDSMRDPARRTWNEVDEASDASFPASDPPSFSPGTS